MKKPPQALSDANLRFPLVETRTAIATAFGVSVEWPLSVSQREEPGAESVGEVMQIEPHDGVPIDDYNFALDDRGGRQQDPHHPRELSGPAEDASGLAP
jgi:hypothetical protein